MESVIELLRNRGLLEACTPELEEAARRPLKLYIGFDPSSDSLHLGNLMGIVAMSWFKRYGHQPIALTGGATGMIGDPGGRQTERQLLTLEVLAHNTLAIRAQLDKLLNRGQEGSFLVYNNYDWFGQFGFLDFLRDVGKYFRLGPMLAKEMVRTRLESEEGLSFTEFSYQLLQGYDFLHLFRTEQVVLQLGGSDQWGNITSGIELIRKVTGQHAFGLVFPLLTRSDGQKFGKSERGAIWLSEEKLSAYEFYQHLYRLSDDDALKLLRMLTFLPLGEIEEHRIQLEAGTCEPNAIQHRLAQEVTRFVHGEEGVASAIQITQKLMPGKETVLDRSLLDGSIPKSIVEASHLISVPLVDLLALLQLVVSKGEARRMIRNGGVYLNNHKINDEHYLLSTSDLIEKSFFLLSVGKKNKLLVEIKEKHLPGN